jgi:hypothetical protein
MAYYIYIRYWNLVPLGSGIYSLIGCVTNETTGQQNISPERGDINIPTSKERKNKT